MKAAPRFELGVQVLQTRALPLGYAAELRAITRKLELPLTF